MFLSTDNDENSILSMTDLDALISYQVRVGQGAVRFSLMEVVV